MDVFDRERNYTLRHKLQARLPPQKNRGATYVEPFSVSRVGEDFYNNITKLLPGLASLLPIHNGLCVHGTYVRVNIGGGKRIGEAVPVIPKMRKGIFTLLLTFCNMDIVIDTSNISSYVQKGPIYTHLPGKRYVLLAPDVNYWFPSNDMELYHRWIDMIILADPMGKDV